MAGRWQNSDRRSTLPRDWAPRIRPAILQRDQHRCTWLGDLVDDDGRPLDYITAVHAGTVHELLDRCAQRATDVDHIGPPDNHDPDNLRGLCSWHHNRRSSRQGNAAKAKRARLRYRPERPHPGLIA
jgi:5-methylcytosine-specific restriction enzyme A